MGNGGGGLGIGVLPGVMARLVSGRRVSADGARPAGPVEGAPRLPRVLSPWGCATETFAPSNSLSTPSVTTTSPAERPLVIAVSSASLGPVFTSRIVTVLSLFTT